MHQICLENNFTCQLILIEHALFSWSWAKHSSFIFAFNSNNNNDFMFTTSERNPPISKN
jgi:hypothetical protein